MSEPKNDKGILDTERCLFGGLLLMTDVSAEDLELSPADFRLPAHGQLFAAFIALEQAGTPRDRVALKTQLRQTGSLDAVGGEDFIDLLDATPPSSANLMHYVEQIKEASTRRRAADMLAEAGATLRSGEGAPAVEQIDALVNRVNALGSQTTGTIEPVKAVSRAALAALEARVGQAQDVTGLRTGLIDLDAQLLGMEPGELVVIAGRPSSGKSALALGVALHVSSSPAEEDGRLPVVALFSAEMTRRELGMRMLASEARVSASRLKTGQILDSDWSKLGAAAGRLHHDRLQIDDSAPMSVQHVRTSARKLARHLAPDRRLSLVIIDYLQLLATPTESRSQRQNREQEVASYTRGLKALAKELGCVVMALSQLSRSPERRDDKRPMLCDLRESGSIEQDANTVIFVFRQEMYDKDNDDVHGIAELIIGKARGGATGTVRVSWRGEFTRFDDLAPLALVRSGRDAAVGNDD